jgi:hypothetical protein
LHGQSHTTFISVGSDHQLPRTILDSAHRVRSIPDEVQDDLLELHPIAGHKREVAGKFGAHNHTVSLNFIE